MCLSSIKNATQNGLIGQVFGFGKQDNSASKEAKRARQETERQEAEKQGRISQGRSNIDSAFSQFDDNYYNNYAQDYTNYYNSDIDQQYTSARDQLMAALASRGMLDSSVGASQTGKLDERYKTERSAIADRASDETNNLKGTVEQQKAALYQTNDSAADPDTIATQATGAVTSLAAGKERSALGQVFADMLSAYGGYTSAKNNSVGSGYTRSSGSSAASNRSGSGRVVS
jgi:hypothetical protein